MDAKKYGHPISYLGRKNYGNGGGIYTRFHPIYRRFEERRLHKLQPLLDAMKKDLSKVPELSQPALKEFDGMLRIFEKGSRKHFYGAFYDGGSINRGFDDLTDINKCIQLYNEGRTGCKALNDMQKEFCLFMDYIPVSVLWNRFVSVKKQVEKAFKKTAKEYYDKNEEDIWRGLKSMQL